MLKMSMLRGVNAKICLCRDMLILYVFVWFLDMLILNILNVLISSYLYFYIY